MRVYADNAATTKLSPAAKEAMLPYFDEIYGNPSTLYTLGQMNLSKSFAVVKDQITNFLECRGEVDMSQMNAIAEGVGLYTLNGRGDGDRFKFVGEGEG